MMGNNIRIACCKENIMCEVFEQVDKTLVPETIEK